MTTMKSRQLNSCRELQAEKRRLAELARMSKSRLDNRLEYFQQNAGSILLSTLSYHLILKQLPVIGDFISQRGKTSSGSEVYPAVLNSVGAGFTMQKAGPILAMAWKVAQPIVVSAVLKRLGRFFEKKR